MALGNGPSGTQFNSCLLLPGKAPTLDNPFFIPGKAAKDP